MVTLCDCNHETDDHEDGRGRCRGIDSYGLPCTCPSVILYLDDEDED